MIDFFDVAEQFVCVIGRQTNFRRVGHALHISLQHIYQLTLSAAVYYIAARILTYFTCVDDTIYYKA